MVKIDGVGFRDISFKDCKVMGVDFTRCNRLMFSFYFEKCILDYSTFYGTKLKKQNL